MEVGNPEAVGIHTNAENARNSNQYGTLNLVLKFLEHVSPATHNSEAEPWDRKVQLTSRKVVVTVLLCGLAYFLYTRTIALRPIERLRVGRTGESTEIYGKQEIQWHGWLFRRIGYGGDPFDYVKIYRSLEEECLSVFRGIKTSLEHKNSDAQLRDRFHSPETETKAEDEKDAEVQRQCLGHHGIEPGKYHLRLSEQFIQEAKDRMSKRRLEINPTLHEEAVQDVGDLSEHLCEEYHVEYQGDLALGVRDRFEECDGAATPTLCESSTQEMGNRVGGPCDEAQMQLRHEVMQQVRNGVQQRRDEAQFALHKRLIEEMKDIFARTKRVAGPGPGGFQQNGNEHLQTRPKNILQTFEDGDDLASDQAHAGTQEVSIRESRDMPEPTREETPVQDDDIQASDALLQPLETKYLPLSDEADSRLEGQPMQDTSHPDSEQLRNIEAVLEATVPNRPTPPPLRKQSRLPIKPGSYRRAGNV